MLGVVLVPWIFVALLSVPAGALCAYRAWQGQSDWSDRVPWLLGVGFALLSLVIVLMSARVSAPSVAEICLGIDGLAGLPPILLYAIDLMRAAFVACAFGICLGMLNVLFVRLIRVDEGDEEADAVRRTLSMRGRAFLFAFPVVMVVTVLVAGAAAYPLPLALVDLGHALALLPVFRSLGVGLDRLGVHVILVNLWHPLSWLAWGPLCFALGLFLVAVGRLLVLNTGASCLRTLEVIGF